MHARKRTIRGRTLENIDEYIVLPHCLKLRVTRRHRQRSRLK